MPANVTFKPFIMFPWPLQKDTSSCTVHGYQRSGIVYILYHKSFWLHLLVRTVSFISACLFCLREVLTLFNNNRWEDLYGTIFCERSPSCKPVYISTIYLIMTALSIQLQNCSSLSMSNFILITLPPFIKANYKNISVLRLILTLQSVDHGFFPEIMQALPTENISTQLITKRLIDLLQFCMIFPIYVLFLCISNINSWTRFLTFFGIKAPILDVR